MPPIKRILQGVAGAFGAALYVWFEAVRAVPRVRRRKLARGVGRRARLRR